MAGLELRKRRQCPSIFSLEREFDDSLREEMERERQRRLLREILHSNEPMERLALESRYLSKEEEGSNPI